MKIENSVRYDSPPAEVYAMLTDPTFREEAVESQGVSSYDVEVEGEEIRIEVERSNDELPSFARTFAGPTSKVVQTEVWNGTDEAEFTITVPGKPGAIQGVRRLVADGSGTLDTFEGEATVKVPLIGGKLEKLIATTLIEGWDVEHRVGTSWLAEED